MDKGKNAIASPQAYHAKMYGRCVETDQSAANITEIRKMTMKTVSRIDTTFPTMKNALRYLVEKLTKMPNIKGIIVKMMIKTVFTIVINVASVGSMISILLERFCEMNLLVTQI